MFGWIFTNILAAIGTSYGWLNIYVGLMTYYAFALLRPTDLWFWSWDRYNQPRYSFYLALSTLAGWFMSGMGDWKELKAIFWPAFWLWVYLGCGIFTWRFTAVNADYAWQYFYPQLTIGIMMMVCLSSVRDERSLKIFAQIIVISTGYLAWVFNSQNYFDGWNRIYWEGFGSVDNNGTAMMMVMAVPLAFFWGIHDKRLWAKGLCFLSVVLEMNVIMFSFSRGGQVGLIMVGIAIFIVAMVSLPNKLLTLAITLMFVWCAFWLAGPQVRERFMTIMPFVGGEGEREASAESRYATWNAAWRCIKDHPLGVGARNFNLLAGNYGLDPGKSVHNLFLQTGADYGVMGMIGLFMFYVSSIWKTFWMARSRVARRLGWPAYFGAMVCISLGGMMVCSQFIGMESVEEGYIVAFLGICTVAYVNRIEMHQTVSERTPLPELEHLSQPTTDLDWQPATD